MREESFVLEGRNGNRMNIAQVIWLYRPNMIPKAAAQDKAGKDCRKDRFHGAGEADASGEVDGSGVGDASELVLGGAEGGSGAVVVSGPSEAGGGSERSVSAEGSGAWSFAEPGVAGPRSAIRFPDPSPFFLGAW